MLNTPARNATATATPVRTNSVVNFSVRAVAVASPNDPSKTFHRKAPGS